MLGRMPIPGFPFLPDAEEFQGPVVALQRFVPATSVVFVLSCDVPLFRAQVADAFLMALGDADAVVPVLRGRVQPLCGLYRAAAWQSLQELPTRRVMDWLERLNIVQLDEDQLLALGLQPVWLTGANTPEAYNELLGNAGMASD